MLLAYLQSIFSFRAYHRMALTSRKVCLAFVLFIFLLSLIVFYFFTGSYVRKNLPVFLKNFPQITFEKGVLTAPDKLVTAPLPGNDFFFAFEAKRATPPTFSEMAEKGWLMLVVGNTIYMPGSGTVQTQVVPEQLSFTTSPDFLTQHQSTLASLLKVTAMAFALFFIPLTLAFDFCLACTIGMIFNLITHRAVSLGFITRWAIFLLGPLSLLWYVRLWWNIPLFTFAQVILCIIYIQQIFNTLPEGK